ncbi:hypothetical protein MNV49_000888 [Pseudohyphozyma bogoriensis]|nr:hypothetical protein MNV49_000888 [Pseudohyphozyma bogoriensis]
MAAAAPSRLPTFGQQPRAVSDSYSSTTSFPSNGGHPANVSPRPSSNASSSTSIPVVAQARKESIGGGTLPSIRSLRSKFQSLGHGSTSAPKGGPKVVLGGGTAASGGGGAAPAGGGSKGGLFGWTARRPSVGAASKSATSVPQQRTPSLDSVLATYASSSPQSSPTTSRIASPLTSFPQPPSHTSPRHSPNPPGPSPTPPAPTPSPIPRHPGVNTLPLHNRISRDFARSADEPSLASLRANSTRPLSIHGKRLSALPPGSLPRDRRSISPVPVEKTSPLVPPKNSLANRYGFNVVSAPVAPVGMGKERERGQSLSPDPAAAALKDDLAYRRLSINSQASPKLSGSASPVDKSGAEGGEAPGSVAEAEKKLMAALSATTSPALGLGIPLASTNSSPAHSIFKEDLIASYPSKTPIDSSTVASYATKSLSPTPSNSSLSTKKPRPASVPRSVITTASNDSIRHSYDPSGATQPLHFSPRSARERNRTTSSELSSASSSRPQIHIQMRSSSRDTFGESEETTMMPGSVGLKRSKSAYESAKAAGGEEFKSAGVVERGSPVLVRAGGGMTLVDGGEKEQGQKERLRKARSVEFVVKGDGGREDRFKEVLAEGGVTEFGGDHAQIASPVLESPLDDLIKGLGGRRESEGESASGSEARRSFVSAASRQPRTSESFMEESEGEGIPEDVRVDENQGTPTNGMRYPSPLKNRPPSEPPAFDLPETPIGIPIVAFTPATDTAPTPTPDEEKETLTETLTLDQMEREIDRMEAELALSGTPRAASSIGFREPSPGASMLGSEALERTNSMASSIGPLGGGYGGSEITPRTARRWSIVEVEQAYRRMKDLLGSTKSFKLESDDGEEGGLDESTKSAGSSRERTISRDSTTSTPTPLRVSTSSDGSGERKPPPPAPAFPIKVEPASPLSVHTEKANTRPLHSRRSVGSSIDDSHDEGVSASSPATSPPASGISTKASAESLAPPKSSLKSNPRRHTFNAPVSQEDLNDVFREQSSAGRRRRGSDSSSTRPVLLSASSARLSRSRTTDTRSVASEAESEDGWATPLSSVGRKGARSPAAIRASNRLSANAPLRSGAGRELQRRLAEDEGSDAEPAASATAAKKRASLQESTTFSPTSPKGTGLRDLVLGKRLSGMKGSATGSSDTWFPSTPDRASHRKVSARHSLRETTSELETETTNAAAHMAQIRGMDKLEIFFKFTATKADLDRAELERDALLDALQESRAALSDVRSQRDAFDIELRKERKMKKLVNNDVDVQEQIEDLVHQRTKWERRARETLAELNEAKEITENLRRELVRAREREEELERENVIVGAKLAAVEATRIADLSSPLMGQTMTFGPKSSFGSDASPLKSRNGTTVTAPSSNGASIPATSLFTRLRLPSAPVTPVDHRLSHLSTASDDSFAFVQRGDGEDDWNPKGSLTGVMPELDEKDEKFLDDLAG